MSPSPKRPHRRRIHAFAAPLVLVLASHPKGAIASDDDARGGYGTDISYPMQRTAASTNYPRLPHNVDPELHPVPPEHKGTPLQPLGDRASVYEGVMGRCRERFGEREAWVCDDAENRRISQNWRQPQSMVNYTDTGIKKIRAPPEVMDLLTEFWHRNRNLAYPEPMPLSNTFMNRFDVPTYFVGIENRTLHGGGIDLQRKISDAAMMTVREWTGQDLTPASVYGVRIYKEGAVLAPHVDRLPLVSSAIVNVAQDADEDWPLEVITHDGWARNVTMRPGDMVLYESHSIIHGRPFPLRGRFYANVFIQFAPEATNDDDAALPPYIIPGSPEAVERKLNRRTLSKIPAHRAATLGDVRTLRTIRSVDPHSLHAPDSMGWTPLHHAARSGRADAVRYLMENGADVDARTEGGRGGTALYYALRYGGGGDGGAVAEVLEGMGASVVVPDARVWG